MKCLIDGRDISRPGQKEGRKNRGYNLKLSEFVKRAVMVREGAGGPDADGPQTQSQLPQKFNQD